MKEKQLIPEYILYKIKNKSAKSVFNRSSRGTVVKYYFIGLVSNYTAILACLSLASPFPRTLIGRLLQMPLHPPSLKAPTPHLGAA